MSKNDKKKLNDSSYSGDEDRYESSLGITENENITSSNILVNSMKIVDNDFNKFINNEDLNFSVDSSFDYSNSNATNLKNKKDEVSLVELNDKKKEKYSVLKEKNKNDNLNLTNYELNKNNKLTKIATLIDNNGNEKNKILNKNKNLYNIDNDQIKDKGKNKNELNIDINIENEEMNTFEKEKNIYEHSPFCQEGYANSNNLNNNNSIINNNMNKDPIYLNGNNSGSNIGFSNHLVQKNKNYDRVINSKVNDLSISNDYLNSSLMSSMLYKENELCFIKYLIVCNFKSYENENIIGPFSKFTAIIGPNGSGKSNIMDCICFVLGINNKYLRIKNLKNLIYHKENEKIDNLNKRECYVKLILECNKENVEIKRTLNYKGVNNFYINDKLVDHKEYMNFLRKNRIETKTKTCLIFQGDIEEIINKKPTELSKLFEYISGSDEYEQIYEDIKDKLKEKQIICKNYLNEKKKIEQELKIHKIQMNENVEHNQLKDDYENDIKILYLFRLYHYLKKKEKFKEDLLNFKEEKMEFEQDILSKNKKIANDLEKNKLIKKKEFLKLEDQIKNQKNQLNDLKIHLNEINEKRKFCENSLNKVQANEKIKKNMENHCSNFINNLNHQIKEQNKKLEDEYRNKLKINLKFFNKYDNIKKFFKQNYPNTYELLKDEKYINKINVNNYNDEEQFKNYNVIQLIENLDDYKKCKEKYLYLCANSNININNYSNLAFSLKKDIKELQEECDNFSRKKQKEILEHESEKLSLDELNDRIKKLNYLIDQDKKCIESDKNKLRELNMSISNNEKQIEHLDEEINVLNIHKNELIFFEKRKEVIKSLKNMYGDDEIYDEVSNLYEVSNQLYYTAVNNVIHKYNNFLVVKNIETCIKCIKYLKDNKLHKMDFIPFENFVSNLKKKKEKKNMSDSMMDDSSMYVNSEKSSYNIIDKVINTFKKKNIILANNCLVCNENYKILFDYLIGTNTLIVESIKDAEDIKDKFPQLNINVVTLKGHIVSKHNNLIIDISSRYADKEKYNNRRLNINLYNKLVNEKDMCRNNINECNKKIIEINESLSKKNSELELNKKKISSILIKKDIFEKEIEAKTMVINTYEEKISKLKNIDIKNKMNTLNNYENELLKERNSLSSFQKDSFEILNNKFKVENIYEAIENNGKEIEKINENIDRIKNNIKKLNDDINELLDKKNEINLFHKKDKVLKEEDIKKELDDLKEEENDFNNKINEINVVINNLENHKLTLLKDLNQINQELNDLREDINNNFEKYETIENKIENSQKKIEIYKNFIKDLINECDINSINIFMTNNILKDIDDEHDDCHENNNKKKRKKKKKHIKQNNKYEKRKSKLLEESENEENNTSSTSNDTTEDTENEEEDDDIFLSNVSFDILSEELKNLENEKDINNEKEKLEKEIEKKKKFLKLRNVNSNAEKEYEQLAEKLKVVDASLSQERKECNLFERNFRILQKKRSYKFLHCFNYIKNIIDNVYNNLTYNVKHHVGGQAFLDLCNYNEFNKDDEPFYCGIKYNNMPPMKRYFEISELSGGEKSISALALIFSIQKYINNSFIILDEVDANMDPLKISSLTRYLNSINSQVIVISLKEKFFSKSQTLIGVYKNKHKKCSKTVTLDISKYRQDVINN
ncbi:structural maintenance of chromosome protein, putative [Plasmodium gallinaceum]|uniref:Structural maintenance of chromosome protein, putative n=1 Tax=Plasmodium gallinaceum TaxID=5849 RepID=A0A1J1GV41_PLAGA|nr:structural maintenance of chromosome protein, putative [Plasmodium gallinaceum]CRG96357.1 structural maintenance of chromosome protein, putative [Plasmodium gallinaceum]